MYLALLCGILVLAILIILIWVAYSVSAAYQQTITITVPFDETYRYVPNLNKDLKYKVNSIKVTVTGSIKKDSLSAATITPGSRIKEIIHSNIIEPYKNCLLIQEANTFIVEEKILKRCP
jgi:Na+-transporting methylmalonyl-CoA/oxaloacetate decarboxylase gamma subunit